MSDYNSTVGVVLEDDFSSLINGVKELRRQLDGLKTQLKQLYELSKSLRNALNGTSLSGATSIPSSINDGFGTKTRQIIQYQQSISSLGKTIDSVGTKSQKSATKFWRFFDLNKLYFYKNYFQQTFRGIANIIQSSLDFTETENYFARAMGNMYDHAMKFQNKLSDMFGTAMNTTMNAQAVYKNMIGSLGGITDELSYKLSETVTKMTLDFSSLYNVDFEAASKKFQSALSKQVRPIRSTSGYDITQNVLKQTASNIGMDKALSDATELEKRLLVIITLMQQMARSGAMNDFSRTIEQPANQLRVLKEQIQEVGRWLGSVFYGILGSILPYINGFVMAIKEVIKWFALLVGYEIPNSSGETGTILDGYGDEWNDLNDSIDDTDAGIDNANKKAKEFQKTIAGFDKLNIIQKPTETPSSSGGGSGAGGLGKIDPAILNALEQYNYVFDDIRMKAMDIRDAILKWGNAAKETSNENIFEPISNSWDRYGTSIFKNFSSGFNNLKILANDFSNTFSSKWKITFQAATDLLFSLLDTGGIVFDGITKLLLVVWNNGGKHLYESVFDLIGVFLELGTAVNDKFVKPTLKWVNKNLVPIFGSFIGLILDLLGYIIDLGTAIVKWVGKTKVVLVPLTSIVVTFFAAWKIAKLITEFKLLKNGLGTFSALRTILSNSIPITRNFFNLFDSGKDKISVFTYTYDTLTNQLLKTKAFDSLGNALMNLGSRFADLSSKSTGLVSVITGALGNAFAWLAANPLVAVAIGIGAVVTAIVAVNSGMDDGTKSTDGYRKSLEELDASSKKLKDSLTEAKASLNDSFSSSDASYESTIRKVERLRSLVGKDGYVSDVEQAKVLIEDINSIIPDTVFLTEQGTLEWKKSNDELQKQIELIRTRNRIEALENALIETEETYREALIKTGEAQQQLSKLESERSKNVNKLNELLDKYNITQNDVNWQTEKYQKLTSEQRSEISKLNRKILEQNLNIRELDDSLKDSNKAILEHTSLEKQLDAQYKATSGAVEDLAEASVSSFGRITKEGTYSYNSLNDALKANQSQMTLHENGTRKMSEEEKKIWNATRDAIIDNLAKRAISLDQSYNEMLKTMDSKGILLSNKEKERLRESYNNYSKGGKDNAKVFNDNLSNGLISEESNKKVKNAANKAAEIISNTIKGTKFNANITSSVDNYSLNNVKNSIANALSGIMSNSALGIAFKSIGIKGFATGGFPNVGEMFIARENGIPEMIGRMGSKNAVANNAQIEAGIENASFRGMMRALQMMGGLNSNQPIVNEITVQVGDEEVAKVVKKADADSIKKTGKGLLER